MTRRLVSVLALSVGLMVAGSTAALACGGLVAPGHAEVLRKAVTLSAWHDGLEHYVTGFQYAGTAEKFGYIIPLPGNPSKIEKAGDWTLERLEREVNPVEFAIPSAAPRAAGYDVTVLQHVTVEALDITVVSGAGDDVAAWARANGFDLTPDTPEVLGRYASQGAVFALAKFIAEEAAVRGLKEGQGQVLHFTIPTRGPWIPLRILALGKGAPELVDADLFLLTDKAPAIQWALWSMPGLSLVRYQQANPSLLADLRSDRGMAWLPAGGMWFTALSLHTQAATITSDLSIDGSGPIGPPEGLAARLASVWWLGAALVAGGLLMLVRRRHVTPLQTA
jgi:hypothetical protein